MDREATAINQFPDFEWHRHTEIIPQTFDSALINMYKARYTANNTFCVCPVSPCQSGLDAGSSNAHSSSVRRERGEDVKICAWNEAKRAHAVVRVWCGIGMTDWQCIQRLDVSKIPIGAVFGFWFAGRCQPWRVSKTTAWIILNIARQAPPGLPQITWGCIPYWYYCS